MHYKIKKRKAGGWSLRSWGTGVEKYVPQDAWPAGLRPDMELEEARGYIKSLNAQARLMVDEARRLAGVGGARRRKALEHALLPATAVTQFERTYLGKEPEQKRADVWVAAQRLIVGLGLEPRLWAQTGELIYGWFASEGYSFDFAKRTVATLNRYGYIYCLFAGAPFLAIPKATATQRVAIDESQEDHRRAEPITLVQLKALCADLPEAQAAWVTVAFWFGLRPEECDQLARPAPLTPKLKLPRWHLEGDVLVVYQPKLRAVREAERFKRIPAERLEQKAALRLVRTVALKRPDRRRFPEGTSAYGLRHGFAVLMDERTDLDRRDLSEWLGHRSVETTERYYLRLGRTARRRRA